MPEVNPAHVTLLLQSVGADAAPINPRLRNKPTGKRAAFAS